MCNKCPTPELAREHQQKAAAGRIKKSKDRYYSNPKICLNCLILLSYEKYKSDRQRKFCSQSCSAKFNNKNKNKEIFLCLNCNKSIKRNRKYCNNKCQSDYEYTKVIDEWKSGKRSGLVGTQAMLSSSIRRYLFEKFNNKCTECGWSKIHSITGKVPLQVDHIDGDCTNNKEDNLRLLCPNCHSLTPTFGSLNKGNSKRRMQELFQRNKT